MVAKKQKGPTVSGGIDTTMQPSMRFDLHKDSHVPKPGDTVHAKVKGKVLNVTQGKDRYGDGKNKTTVEIEHEPNCAMCEPALAGKGRRTIAEMEDADERV